MKVSHRGLVKPKSSLSSMILKNINPNNIPEKSMKKLLKKQFKGQKLKTLSIITF
jgi:hypothetical protein